MKKGILLATLFIVIGALAACGKDPSEMTDKELSKNYCEGCHGNDLANRGLSEKEILEAVQNGASGMNADILKGKDAARVSAYWAEKQ